MKRLFSFFVLLGAMIWANAAPVDLSRAQALALTFWNQSGCAARSGSAASDFTEVSSQAGFQNLYIFVNVSGTGFVVMSADDIAHPVLAYSETSGFDAAALPSNVAGWLGGYDRTIGEAVAHQAVASVEVSSEWEALASGTVPVPKSTTAVSPLISTSWDQGSPYNAQCPGVSYNRAPTGCVATALAQVMKYWSYPSKGMRSHSYTCSYYSQTLSADFGSTTYNWSGMPNSVTSSNTSVATLMFHLGVATEMEYTPSGSGAQMLAYWAYDSDYSAETALKKYFGYSSTLHGERKDLYSDADWISMLKAELNAGRPIPYSGVDQSDNVGHAFVCDGYNNSNQFHFNWGWSGAYDGYFSLTSLAPGSGGWGSGNGDYTYSQCAIFGIEPPQLRATTHNSSNMTASNGGYIVEHGAPLSFTINIKAASAFNGSLRLVIMNTSLAVVQNVGSTITASISANQTVSKTFSTDVVTAYPGNYLICLQYQPSGSSDWITVGTDGCVVPADLTVVINPDAYENNNTVATAYTLPVNFSQNHAVVQTTGSNFHSSEDTYDYYRFELPEGYHYRVNSRVHDMESSGNGHVYTADVRFNVSVNGAAWGSVCEDIAPEYELDNGGPVVFKVRTGTNSSVGTYLLDVDIVRTVNTGVSEQSADLLFSVYPNPATDVLHFSVNQDMVTGSSFQILDIFGRVVKQESVTAESFVADVRGLDSGLYFVRIVSDGQVIATKKFVKR